jgi:hypothetical protein
MQTYTGRPFWPLDPRPEDVDPLDIAAALSMICRYGGHTHRFYSVAEHCWLLSHAVAPEHALWALLHDATEAYVGDMVRPLKRSMPEYAAAEDHLMRVICDRVGLPYECPAEVKEADNRILLDERAALTGRPPLPWHQDEASVQPLGVSIWALSPEAAKIGYLCRLDELLGVPAQTVTNKEA